MNPVIKSENLSDAVKRIVFNQAGTYTAGIIAVVKDEEMSDAAKRIVLQRQGRYVANISGVISKDVPDSVKTLLLNSNTSAFITFTVSKVTLTEDQQKLLDAIMGAEDGKITITGGFSFEPSKAFSTLYDGMTKEVAKLKFTDLIQSLNKLELAIRIQNEAAAAARKTAATSSWNKLAEEAKAITGPSLSSAKATELAKAKELVAKYVQHYNLQEGLGVTAPSSIGKLMDVRGGAVLYANTTEAIKALSSVSTSDILKFAETLQNASTSNLRVGLPSTTSFTSVKAAYTTAESGVLAAKKRQTDITTIKNALKDLAVSYPDLFSAKDADALKMFASGGAFSNGIVSTPTAFSMGMMGEAGPEAIMPLTNVGGSLGVRAQMPDMEEVVDELRSLRSEVINLRAEVRADVSYNAKTAKLLDRVIPDGQSVSVKTAA